jgi:hypothetical protein
VDQILYYINHLSFQSAVPIILTVMSLTTAIINIIHQHNKRNDNNHIFVHHISYPRYGTLQTTRWLDNISRIFTVIIYLVFFISVSWFLYSFFVTSEEDYQTSRAQLVISDYYGYINGMNYKKAFDVIKSANEQDYKGFASGFSNTIHDNITFDESRNMPNGDIEIFVTVKALEACSLGTRTSIYHDTYTLRYEHENYIIVNYYGDKGYIDQPCSSL